MDKDTLKAIKIINEILGHLANGLNQTQSIRIDRIKTKRQDLFNIIKDNEERLESKK